MLIWNIWSGNSDYSTWFIIVAIIQNICAFQLFVAMYKAAIVKAEHKLREKQFWEDVQIEEIGTPE